MITAPDYESTFTGTQQAHRLAKIKDTVRGRDSSHIGNSAGRLTLH